MGVHFEPGQVIFREGDIANRFYLIERGEIALESSSGRGETIPIQSLGSQDVLGWSWLFPPYYYHFDARVLKPTDAIFFYGTRIRELCESDAELGYELLKKMAMTLLKRLRAWTQKLAEITPRAAETLPHLRPSALDWTYDNTKSLHRLIAGHPFLKTISQGNRLAISAGVYEKVFESGELIVKSGDFANEFFLIVEGQVALEHPAIRGPSIPIQIVDAGDVVGWSWLLPPFTSHFQARALERTRTLVLNGARLLILSEANHDLGYELMCRITELVIQRLQATRKYVLLHQRQGFVAVSGS